MKSKSSEQDILLTTIRAYGTDSLNINQPEKDDEVKSTSILSLLRRFILQGNILEFTFQKLLLAQSVLYKQRRKSEPFSHHLLLSNTIPIADESAISRLKILNNTTEGLRFFAKNIWPLTLLGLILQDVTQFALQPSRRYETTEPDLATGFYRRDWALASGQFSGFPNQIPFWLLPGGMLALPLVTMLLESVLQSSRMMQEDKITDALTQAKRGAAKLALLPYSAYRRALTAAGFILAWDHQPDFARQRQGWLNEIKEIARKGPLIPALSAIGTLARLADSPLNYAYPGHEILVQEHSSTNCHCGQEHYSSSEQLLLQSHNYAEPASQAMQFLHHLAGDNGVRSEVARLYLWRLGQKTSAPRQLLYSLKSLGLFSLFAYSSYRYGLILEQRGMQAYQFFKEQSYCQQQHKTWHYWPVTGDYTCSIGGNYSFVPPAKANDPQGCLNALLASSRPVAELMDALSHFRYFTGYYQIDLTAWSNNFLTWDVNTTEAVFTNMLALSPSWALINISSSAANNVWPINSNIVAIGNALSKVVINQFDGSGFNMGPQSWYNFLQAWQPKPGLQIFLADNNNIGEAGLDDFSDWCRNNTLALTQISLANNAIPDNGGAMLLKNLPSYTTYLDLSQNRLSSQFLSQLAEILPDTALQTLIVSNNDFSGTDYAQFGSAVAASNLTTLQLDQVNMQDFDLAEFALGLSNQTQLVFFSVARNQLTSQGICSFAQSGGYVLQAVNFSLNRLTDADLLNIMPLLDQTNWQAIDLSHNLFSSDAVAQFWSSLKNNTVYSIRMAGMRLDENAFSPFVELLNNSSISLSNLDISNNALAEQFAAQLFNAVCLHNVSRINLAGNGLSALFSNITTWPVSNYTCTDIDLSDNAFTSEEILPLLDQLPQFKSLQRLTLDNANSFDKNAARALATALITPIPNPDDLDDMTISSDELAALNQSKPVTSLTFFSINNVLLDRQAALPLCNIAPHLPNLDIQALNNGFSINPLVNCETSSASRLQPFGTGISSGILLSTIPIVNLLVLGWLLYQLIKAGISTCTTPFRQQSNFAETEKTVAKKSFNNASYAMNI